MSTYVMSDIHGCFDLFQEMLKKIKFSDDDVLILAGDYIDRGSQSLEMLEWIKNRPGNVIAIKGNHDMAFVENVSIMEGLAQETGLDLMKLSDSEKLFIWYKECKKQLADAGFIFFDWDGTLGQLIEEKHVNFAELKEWANCLDELIFTYEFSMNNRRCIVVHAGYIESLEGVEMEREFDSIEDFYVLARDDAYIYGGVAHGMIIAGHTPTVVPNELPFNDGNVYRSYDEALDCIFYDIDCGCAYGISTSKLACIRVEDEKVFYVKERQE